MRLAKTDMFSGRVRMIPGWDRMSLAAFERQRDQHLRAVSRKALAGRYTFRPFVYRDFPKPDSVETRRISRSTIRDGLVQRALAEVLVESIETLLTDSCYAYR